MECNRKKGDIAPIMSIRADQCGTKNVGIDRHHFSNNNVEPHFLP
jgi:hypothetical protein